jgi:hypothetical protein
VAAISVTAQRPKLEPAELREQLVKHVVGAAAELSRRLNHQLAAEAAEAARPQSRSGKRKEESWQNEAR